MNLFFPLCPIKASGPPSRLVMTIGERTLIHFILTRRVSGVVATEMQGKS